jgi:hypothetical protein
MTGIETGPFTNHHQQTGMFLSMKKVQPDDGNRDWSIHESSPQTGMLLVYMTERGWQALLVHSRIVTSRRAYYYLTERGWQALLVHSRIITSRRVCYCAWREEAGKHCWSIHESSPADGHITVLPGDGKRLASIAGPFTNRHQQTGMLLFYLVTGRGWQALLVHSRIITSRRVCYCLWRKIYLMTGRGYQVSLVNKLLSYQPASYPYRNEPNLCLERVQGKWDNDSEWRIINFERPISTTIHKDE